MVHNEGERKLTEWRILYRALIGRVGVQERLPTRGPLMRLLWGKCAVDHWDNTCASLCPRRMPCDFSPPPRGDGGTSSSDFGTSQQYGHHFRLFRARAWLK